MDWLPIDHVPPLPRIETSPSYTPAPPSIIPGHVLEQIEQLQEMERKKNGDRIWELVIQSAKGG